MRLRQFIQERVGGLLLEIANEDIFPGVILDVERESGLGYWAKEAFTVGLYDQKYRIRRSNGAVWRYTGRDGSDFESSLVAGNLVQEQIKHELALDAKAALPQYGVAVSGDINATYSAVLRIGKIQARVFRDPAILYSVSQDVLALSKTDIPKWEWLNGDFLISETYYTTELSWVFCGEGAINAKADFENAGFEASGGISASWKNNNELSLSGEPSVPFAVRGMWL